MSMDIGRNFLMSSLDIILPKVKKQKFYEINWGDFVFKDSNTSNWIGNNIIQLVSTAVSGGFHEGDQSPGSATLSHVSVGGGSISMPSVSWAKSVTYNALELLQAARNNNISFVEENIMALKKSWELGIQEVAFLGNPNVPGLTGLINNPNVTINTTTLRKSIHKMTPGEINNLLSGLLREYQNNTQTATMPNTFLIPSYDWVGMGSYANANYPGVTIIESMQNMFRAMTGNPNFKIGHAPYLSSSKNVKYGINKNRYMLYNNDMDSLAFHLPNDFQIGQRENTANGFNYEVAGWGHYSGVIMTYPREVIYFDF